MYPTNKSFNEVVEALLMPGSVTILGITGQAGAGKSQFISPLVAAAAQAKGFAYAHLGLDAFFKLSSRGRREWIAAGAAEGAMEQARREDQINWWDFEAAQRSLAALKRGETLHLTGVYNRADGGELTGEVRIEPPTEGMLVVFEGVAITHLNGVDEMMYVHAPSAVRFERLFKRDAARRRSREEALERFGLTQTFERRYFPQYWDRITCFIDNSARAPQVLSKHEMALMH